MATVTIVIKDKGAAGVEINTTPRDFFKKKPDLFTPAEKYAHFAVKAMSIQSGMLAEAEAKKKAGAKPGVLKRLFGAKKD